MRKRLTALIAALLCLALLTACGTQGGTPAGPEPAPADEAPADTVPASGGEGPAPAGEDIAPAEDAAGPVTVTDDLGNAVTFDGTPERVAVLTASFAETWLLAGGKLCATVSDAWDDFDLDLEGVSDLGTYMHVSMELLFEADPDLVILSSNTSTHLEMKDTLEKAGIRTLWFGVSSFPDYLRMLKVCTDVTGRRDLYEINGLEVEKRVEAAKAEAAAHVAEEGAPQVLYLRAAASAVRAKGSDGTVLGEMLADIGCVNIADGSDLLEDLSIEKIIETDPEYVLIVQQGDDVEAMERLLEETLTGNPAWAGLRAVKEDRVFFLDKQLYHLKPNARWGEAYEKLVALFWPA